MYETFDNKKFLYIILNISIYLLFSAPFASGDSVVASKGYITQMDISPPGKFNAKWQGFYGIIQNGNFVDFNLTGNISNVRQLNITSPSNIQYLLFSTSTLDSLSGFSPGNITQLDTIIGSGSDNATYTFIKESNFTLAGTTIYDVPTVYTNVNRTPQVSYFREGFLKKDSIFVFITDVQNNIGFNNMYQDFQVILPIVPPSLNMYYVYAAMFEENKTTTSSGFYGGSCSNGIFTTEEQNNIQFYEIRERYLQKNVSINYIFTTPDISIYELILTPIKSFGSICIRNEQLKDLSKIKDLTIPEGIIYEYVNIYAGLWEATNAGFTSDVILKFRIKMDWLKSNDIEDNSIVLQRWNGSKWILLETEKNNSDEKFIYYQATTEAFGPFAISSVHPLYSPTTIPTLEIPTTTIQTTAIQTTAIEPPEKRTLPSVKWWYFSILITTIIILLSVLLFYLKYLKTH